LSTKLSKKPRSIKRERIPFPLLEGESPPPDTRKETKDQGRFRRRGPREAIAVEIPEEKLAAREAKKAKAGKRSSTERIAPSPGKAGVFSQGETLSKVNPR
jgi:hypothetical protein